MRQHIRAFSFLASALLIASCGGNPRVLPPPANAPLPVAGVANPCRRIADGHAPRQCPSTGATGIRSGRRRIPPRVSTACCSCSTPRPRSKRRSRCATRRAAGSRIRRSIINGSRPQNSALASARAMRTSRKCPRGSSRTDSLSMKSLPDGGSSSSPAQPHRSSPHFAPACTSTASTEPIILPTLQGPADSRSAVWLGRRCRFPPRLPSHIGDAHANTAHRAA
jgi:hypothetical protein